MTGDITFLLIFVILPTALIVSGIWLVLFIRREPEVRSIARGEPVDRREASGTSPEPAAKPQAERPEEAAYVASSHGSAGRESDDAALETLVDLDTAATVAEPESDKDAVEELSLLAADLLYNDPRLGGEPAVDDSRLLELLDPADREIMARQMSGGEVVSSPERIEPTEEIPGVAAAESAVDEAVADTGELPAVEGEDRDEEWRPRPATDEPAGRSEEPSEAKGSGDEPDEEAEFEGGEFDGDRRPRQPRAKLLPTGEAERRRGRTSGRRVPPIGRLSRRNESGMESGDSTPDVSTGYGE